MKNTADFYEENDNLEAALHIATLFTFDEAWLQAHRMTKEQAEIDSTRLPYDTAMNDYQDMVRFRKLSPEASHLFCLAEKERMAH